MNRGEDHDKNGASTTGLVCWALYDWGNSAFVTVIQTFLFAAYFTRQVAADEASGSALWGNAIGAAGICVAVGAPLLGAIADHTGRRKPWIAALTAVCVVFTAALWWVRPRADDVWLALPLLVIATVSYEYAAVFYNAMLPALASPKRVGRWSGWAWGLGYAGGLAALLLVLLGFVRQETALFRFDREAAEHVRAACIVVAVWYAVFALPLLLFTPDAKAAGVGIGAAARQGLQQLWNTLRRAREHRAVLHFLLARMIYTDGLLTVFVFGGVYAAGTFDMSEQEVLMFGIGLNVTAAVGAGAFAWIDDRIGGKRTVIVSLIGLIVSGAWLLAVDTRAWLFGVGLFFGLFVGPVQAASRSYLARVAPQKMRNEMFGLYALSGKATSFVGPLMVGWITYWSGSQRIGMSAAIALMLIGLVLMWSVRDDTSQTRANDH